MKILLVEDDSALADGLMQTLTQSGYEVSCAINGLYADCALHTQDFELVILDLNLPGLSGREVLRRLRRRKSPVPVLILTASDGLNDRINGLECGADDYMIKPFDLRELEARIRALIRRSYGGFSHDIVVGRLTLDTLNHQIRIDNEPIMLSAREYSVLEILLLRSGCVVSKDKIAQRLSARGEVLGDNAIEVYVHRLRKRLETWEIEICTVRGLGYLLKKGLDVQPSKS